MRRVLGVLAVVADVILAAGFFLALLLMPGCALPHYEPARHREARPDPADCVLSGCVRGSCLPAGPPSLFHYTPYTCQEPGN